MGPSGRIARFFLTSQLTPLIALIAALLGLFAILVTPREEEPQINVTMANVFIPFPGASAKDVEALVATPAEQVLSQIAGIEHIYSVSKPGMAVLTVQYLVGQDRTQALVRLYDTIQANRDWVSPELGVGEPIIKPLGIDDVPIVTVTLWTRDPARGAYELEQAAHAAEIELKRIAGTREVTTVGGPGRAVRVMMDPERMAAFGVTAKDIRDALQVSNAAQPSGTLVSNNQEILVQTGTFLTGAADVKQLVVGVSQGRPVYMNDVATVVAGPDQPARYVWYGPGAGGADQPGVGQTYPAVTLAVSKKPGENAVDVAEKVIARVQALENSVLPEGVEVSVTRNYGATADDKAKKLIQKLIFATASVVLLVLFAIGRREALIVGAAVLLTLAATLFASWAWGFTLNRVSLFALIFSIGILVDDAIVVVENIHRRMGLDHDGLEAIIPRAVDEVGGPTILATLTVIAALLPMAFVSGLMGPYMSPIPINASIGMVISLAIAFIVTPWLALKLIKQGAHGHAEAGNDKLLKLFRARLTPFLRGEAGKGARRKLWLGIGAAILISVALPVVQLVILKMLPFDNKSEFQIIVDMPVGTPLEKTAQVLAEMGEAVAKVPEVTDYQAYAGTAAPINFNGLVRQYYLRSGPEVGDLQVNLVDKHERDRKSHDIAQAIRPVVEVIANKHGADVKVVEVPPGPPVMSPIVAEIYGPDYDAQITVAKQVRGVFEKTDGIVAIDDTVEDDAQRFVLRVLQNKAAVAGVAQKDVVAAMKMGLSGENVTPIHGSGAKYEIPVRITLPPEKQSGIDELLKLTVRGNDGNLVPLSELVEVMPTEREKTIYHKDLLPVVFVVGDTGGALDSPLYGLFGMRGELKDRELKEGGTLAEYFIQQPDDPYAGFALKWDGEWQVTYETFRDMGIAYAVGLILIYILVVAQFKSYLTPLIIMAPIPLTIIGVMPGHALLGAQFTATSMIGMIALAGIIVRNSILLVDFINQQTRDGMDFQEAVIQAGATRAKPIVLTGLAAMLGAFFILDDPIFSGLAVALIFGIAVSTLLTLVVIPVLYYAANYRTFSRQ
ncbi:MAG: multidrug transporter AcrB [Hydrogenophilales bacterium 16-64-46]|nr:MAG: multidrug transporter AcrB [Hydrogenophilales bacterium 12-64-13]OYZ07064.1 MAG: multidrug transporter AcrB [Hydrogenophilales bacterium 16-64-46]OZA37771.1 MAG: multidrug transporter AcrB [Hydrogenophilales bacterium 17-64-34]HQS99277.1 efflux RND transporter permease subunit [Thiobacillus sp.]